MLKNLICKPKKDCGKCAAVIVAAGSSSRMSGTDKILVPMEGKPLIVYTIGVFQNSPAIQEIVIVTRKDLIEQITQLCRENGFDKVKTVVCGGETRAQSVMSGLDQVSKSMNLVAVHDGARPFVTTEIIETTVRKAKRYHAVAPAIPVKDTIKVAENRIVIDTLDRRKLFAVQTPQVFDFDLLRGALQTALLKGLPITDDCSAAEALGMSVYLTDGSEENIKVTTPMDLMVAEAILRHRRAYQ